MKKIILFSVMILLFVTSASAILKLNTALNMITGGAGNFTTVNATTYYGDGSHLTGIDAETNNITVGVSGDATCNCSNRLLTSEASATYIVHSNQSINELICARLPYLLRHRITVNVDGNYTRNEDVCIPPYIGEQSIDYSGGQFRLRGAAGENVYINSIFASGISGQANPYFYNFNVTGYHPYYTGNCAVCLFGVHQTELYNMRVTGTAEYGITSYGSNVKVRDTFLGYGLNNGLETKQGGRIYASNMTGLVDEYAYYTAGGDILIDLGAGSSVSTLGGTLGKFKQTVGYILEQRGSSYDQSYLWGVQSFPEAELIAQNETNLAVNSTYTVFQGRVGIGINSTTPAKDLEVTTPNGGVRVLSQTADNFAAGVALAKRGNATDYYGVPVNTSEAGHIYFDAWINANYRHIARITGKVAGNPSSSSYVGLMSFNVVETGSTSLTEKLVIDETGVALKDAACTGLCTVGVIGYNTSHFCVCTATNTWKRVAIS